MFLEILLAITLGVTSGIFTGLTPGVHINLVAALLLGLSPFLAQYLPLLALAIFIMSMAVTHNFIDMVPAIYLGAPEDATALGVLPGHRYLLMGQGLMAIKLTVIGGIAGTLLVILLFLPSMWLLNVLYTTTRSWLFWILIIFTLFTIWKDKKRAWALLVFSLSGVLGIIVLRLPLDEPLLPMLSGLFGTATLLYSIKEENNIPEQQDLEHTDFDIRKTVIGSVLGSFGAFFTALFPGISTAMAAALVSRFGKLGDHGFMVLLGALGSVGFILSLASWLSIEKARNGAMAVLVQLQNVSPSVAIILLASCLIATGIAAVLTLNIARFAGRFLPRIPYAKTCVSVIIFVTLIVIIRTGWLGLIVLLTSTAVGLLPATLKTARAQGMGCLMLPLLVVLI